MTESWFARPARRRWCGVQQRRRARPWAHGPGLLSVRCRCPAARSRCRAAETSLWPAPPPVSCMPAAATPTASSATAAPRRGCPGSGCRCRMARWSPACRPTSITCSPRRPRAMSTPGAQPSGPGRQRRARAPAHPGPGHRRHGDRARRRARHLGRRHPRGQLLTRGRNGANQTDLASPGTSRSRSCGTCPTAPRRRGRRRAPAPGRAHSRGRGPHVRRRPHLPAAAGRCSAAPRLVVCPAVRVNDFTLARLAAACCWRGAVTRHGQLGQGDQQDRAAPAVILFAPDAGPVTGCWPAPLRRGRHRRRPRLHLGATRRGQGGRQAAGPQTRPARVALPGGPRPAAVTGGTDHVIVTFANAENGQ